MISRQMEINISPYMKENALISKKTNFANDKKQQKTRHLLGTRGLQNSFASLQIISFIT
jgi:hypothetical protein